MDRTAYQMYKEYKDGEFENWYLNKDVGGGCMVIKIEYHAPSGEGDAHYCDIYFSDKSMRRTFNPDNIDFESED